MGHKNTSAMASAEAEAAAYINELYFLNVSSENGDLYKSLKIS